MSRLRLVIISERPTLIQEIKDSLDHLAPMDFTVFPTAGESIFTELANPKVCGVVIDAIDATDSQILSCAALLGDSFFADRKLPCVICTADSRSRSDLDWFRLGAKDVLHTPLQPTRLAKTVRAWQFAVNNRPQPQDAEIDGPWLKLDDKTSLYTASPAISRVMVKLRRLADRDCNILLSGETGVGKTAIARLIHHWSPRRDHDFCAVNCSALPESLIESELFGHRRGSFTGADHDQVGWFSAVGKGTLFLDEVDALTLPSQSKLLKVVDEREFQAIGDRRKHEFNGRLVSATNQSLETLVEQNKFRADLFFRLGVVEVKIPALRTRRDEIAALASHFLAEESAPGETLRFEDAALAALQSYHWPGNIRELRNLCQSCAALAESSSVTLADLPPTIASWAPDTSSEAAMPLQASTLAAARNAEEVRRIKQALQQTNNNRTAAARQLGISRAALYKKLDLYKLVSFGSNPNL